MKDRRHSEEFRVKRHIARRVLRVVCAGGCLSDAAARACEHGQALVIAVGIEHAVNNCFNFAENSEDGDVSDLC